MINSIIDLREDSLTKVMIPFEKVFMLNSKEKINEDLLKRVKIKGYSKIPIFEQNKNNVMGIHLFFCHSYFFIWKRNYKE